MDDRRRFKRFDASYAVLLKTSAGQTEPIKARMTDISFSGIGVEVQAPIGVGEKLTIQVQEAGHASEPLHIGEGEVVSARSVKPGSTLPWKLGVRFAGYDEAVVQKLLEAIQSQRLLALRQRGRSAQSRSRKTGEWL